MEQERQQRKAKVAMRRERRLQEKNLFDNDVVERKKREEDSDVTVGDYGEDYDYSYYYYGEGDDYEVYVGGKSTPARSIRCDPSAGAEHYFLFRLRR